MVLDRLPIELQVEVLRHLGSESKLASIALCSRHYYDLALPILYSAFKASPSKTPAFLRTIIDRPDLALYVKHLTGFEAQSQSGHSCSGCPQENIDGRLWAAIEKVCKDASIRNRWFEDLYNRNLWGDYDAWVFCLPRCGYCWGPFCNWDAITALLLLCLPNLTSLVIPWFTGRSGHHLLQECVVPVYIPFIFNQAARLQQSGTGSAHSLSKLRWLHIEMDTEADLICLDSIYPILGLKSIQYVSCTYDDLIGQTFDFSKDIAPLPHITRLSFHKSDVRSAILDRFLRPFTGLTHFAYVLDTGGEGENSFIPHIIYNGLKHLKDTLRELILVNLEEEWNQQHAYEGEDWPNDHQPENRPLRPLGPLADFRYLRRFEATAVVLVGRENASDDGLASLREIKRNQRVPASLPESLEELVLHACTNEIYGTMYALFEARRLGRLSKLKKITLCFQQDTTLEQIWVDEEGLACELEGKDAGITVIRLGACDLLYLGFQT